MKISEAVRFVMNCLVLLIFGCVSLGITTFTASAADNQGPAIFELGMDPGDEDPSGEDPEDPSPTPDPDEDPAIEE